MGDGLSFEPSLGTAMAALAAVALTACGPEGGLDDPGPSPSSPPPASPQAPPAPVAEIVETPGPEIVIGRPTEVGDWRISPGRFVVFGRAGSDCGLRRRSVAIENLGQVPGEIEVLGIDAPFELNPATPDRLEVGAGALTQLEVFLPPSGAGELAGQLSLRLDGQPDPTAIELRADVIEDLVIEDVFRQLERTKTDILFVIDTELEGEAEWALQANLRAFFQYLEAMGLDARVAFTDGGFGPGGLGGRRLELPSLDGRAWARPTEPEAIADVVDRAVGFSSPDRQLLRSALEVVQERPSDFLRPEAVLAMVIVTDGDDGSPGSLDRDLDLLRAKLWPRPFSISTISGPPRNVPRGKANAVTGCSSRCGAASPSPRLVAAASNTGGVFQSLCTCDWSRSLEEYSSRLRPTRGFLSARPRLQTLTLEVEDEPLPAQSRGGTVHWVYAPNENLISFAPYATPEPGARWTARYQPSCAP